MSKEVGREPMDEDQLIGRLDIHGALRTEWTRQEKNPPEDSEYTNWLVPVGFVPSDKLLQLLKIVSREYGYNLPETVRRLLRYGVQELEHSVTAGEFEDVKAYHDLTTHASAYDEGTSYGFSPFTESEKVPIDWGRTTGNRPKTFKIVWTQNNCLEQVSQQLCITRADACRWAVFEAGKALGEEEDIPGPLSRDVAANVEEMREYLKEKMVSIKGPAVYAVMEALKNGYLEQVRDYAKEDNPELWEEIISRIAEANAALEEEEFLYPTKSLMGSGVGKT